MGKIFSRDTDTAGCNVNHRMGLSTIELGKIAEHHAEKFLADHNLKILARNYRSQYGEIDLIMHDVDTLVFIEVRYRRNQHYGSASESIDFKKQEKIIRTAHKFLKTYQHNRLIRFDVITFDGDLSTPSNWIQNAFEAE